MDEIGKVTHYFGKIGVAIVALSGDLQMGDRIKVEGNRTEFEQAVDSREVDRKPVEAAARGQSVGLKIVERTNEGATVYKLGA